MPGRRRSAILAAATVVVAALLALAVPVSQLRTSIVQTTCCCPDPEHCHCPAPSKTCDGLAHAQRCHTTYQDLVTSATPVLVPPPLAPAPSPVRALVAIAAPLPSPHAPPSAARPSAPS